MSELRACRICLSTGVKMYRIDRYHLKSYYEEVMAMKVINDNLPKYFCFECATFLHKFHKFKEKCYSGQKALKEMLWKGAITYDSIAKLDRNVYKNLHPVVQQIPDSSELNMYYLFINDDTLPAEETETETVPVKFEETEVEIIGPDNDNVEMIGPDNDNIEIIGPDNDNVVILDTRNDSHVEIIHTEYNNDSDYRDNVEMHSDIEAPCEDNVVEIETEETIISDQCVEKVFLNIKNENNIIDIKQTNTKKSVPKDFIDINSRKIRFLDAANWEKLTLTEEVAVQEFKERSQNIKYLRSNFKCTDCYKGFSKVVMLNRHIESRHSEALGNFVCRFCKMRFKVDSFLRIHMRQHFTRYKCLRCKFTCPLENSALLHDDYHTGKARQCKHCDKIFKHPSTYYSHVRTVHRSVHVCVACGASFVSEAGLQQHKKLIHQKDEIESPGDDEQVNTYCERCDISFISRKAYEEHMFNSLLHTEGVEDQVKTELDIPRKVLGKRRKNEISNKLWKRGDEVYQDDDGTRYQRKTKRKRRRKIPTTCYQCGQQFESQKACMAHHLEEHPGTSFTPAWARYICELCGASLAPGSVAIHQNMHTREKVYPCATCGRQFSSSVGLTRHHVTHTGEKRYGCPLCSKRFTQSNSMKLHYRTFHLKQPYPKRNRKKPKVAEASERRSSDDRSELDSIPEQTVIEHVITTEMENEEVVHYLTLD